MRFQNFVCLAHGMAVGLAWNRKTGLADLVCRSYLIVTHLCVCSARCISCNHPVADLEALPRIPLPSSIMKSAGQCRGVNTCREKYVAEKQRNAVTGDRSPSKSPQKVHIHITSGVPTYIYCVTFLLSQTMACSQN